MANTKETIDLVGQDRTAAAFNSVIGNAKRLNDEGVKVGATFSNLRGIISGIGAGLVVRAIDRVIGNVNELGKAAKVAGMSAEALQEYRYALGQLADITDNQVDDSLRRFNTRLGQMIEGGGPAKTTIEKLGIAVQDMRGKLRSTDNVLADALTALANVENGASRAAHASALFGDDAGPILAQALASGIDSVDELVKKMRDAGWVLSNEMVQGAEDAADAIDDMKKSLGTEFTKLVTDNTDAISRMAGVVMNLGNAFGFVVTQSGRSIDQLWGIISGISPAEIEKANRQVADMVKPVEIKIGYTADEDALEDIKKETAALFDDGDPWLNKIRDREWDRLDEEFERIAKQGTDAMESISEASHDMSNDLIGQFDFAFSSMEDTIVDFVRTGKLSFRSLVADMIEGLTRMAVRSTILGPLQSALGGVLGGMFNPAAALAPIALSSLPQKRAMGGPVTAGMPYIVGENEPELFVPRQSGQIIPGHQMGTNVTNNISLNIDAPGADQRSVELIRQIAQTEIIPAAIQGATLNTINKLRRPSFA